MPKISPLRMAALICSCSALGLATAAWHRANEERNVVPETRVLTWTYALTDDPSADRSSLTTPTLITDRLQPGETFAELLARLGANDATLLDYSLSAPEAKALHRRLLGGGQVSLLRQDDGTVHAISLPLTRGERVWLQRQDDAFVLLQGEAIPSEPYHAVREGVIRSSLFATADEIGLPMEIASRLAEVFGTEIDFSRDLRSGDHFVVVYEVSVSALGEERVGDIIAAEFTNRGKTYHVVRYTNAAGETGFYTLDGKALGQGFLRYPLKFTRVSSTFGRRHHPVTGEYKNHAGVDLAAPTGTPVLAASDGRVKFVGFSGAYGNLVILEHRNGYETRYGHLSAFAAALKTGQRIQQTQVIGFVGATGRVTGPHLHYEVRINGSAYNPQTVQLPSPESLPAKELARFHEQTAAARQQLAAAARRPEMAQREALSANP